MAKLSVSLDGKSLGEFILNKERTSIGRRPTSDIHIDHLAVSTDHALIVTLGTDSFLEDLESTNGTVVNQKLIKKHVLQHNDVIELGRYRLQYIDESRVQSSSAQTVADMYALAAVGNARFVVLNGVNAGQEVILNNAMVKLGETGQRALVTKRATGYFLSHIEGASRPLVNGQPVASIASMLNDNDIVEIAGVKMKFQFD